jgi:glutamate synthase domain-containing protein 2
MPLVEGLTLVHNMLIGCGIREHITLIASGKVISGFDVVKTIALGADVCNSARGMMFSLGCIQALKCGSNRCPTGR